VEPHLPQQVVQGDEMSLPLEEFTTVQLGGPVDVEPHPRNPVTWLSGKLQVQILSLLSSNEFDRMIQHL